MGAPTGVNVEELRAENEELKQRNEELQKRLDDLVNQLDALKAEAKKSGKPCAASLLKRAPAGAREGFTLNLKNTCGEKVHLLKPEPYVFRPLEKAYLRSGA